MSDDGYDGGRGGDDYDYESGAGCVPNLQVYTVIETHSFQGSMTVHTCVFLYISLPIYVAKTLRDLRMTNTIF